MTSRGVEIGELPALSDDLPAALLVPVAFEPVDDERRDRRRRAERKKYVRREVSVSLSPPLQFDAWSDVCLTLRGREKTRLKALTVEAAELEKKLKLLLNSDEDDEEKVEVPSDEPMSRDKLERMIHAAVRTKVLLREENAALRRQVMEATQYRLSLRHALSLAHLLTLSYGSSLVTLKPISTEQCHKFHVEGVELARSFLTSTIKNAWVRTVHSWHEGQALQGDIFNYIYQKTLRGFSAADLCHRSFAMFADPTRLEKFYSPEQDVSLRVLQKVDDNNVLLFEEMVLLDTDEQLVVSKSIVLVARVATATGFQILLRCLTADEIAVENQLEIESRVYARPGQSVREIWAARMQWMQFDTRGKDCVVSYAGIIPTEGFSAQYWVDDFETDTLKWQIAVGASPYRLSVC